MRSDVNGVAIEFEVAGDGTPVVLLHGFPDSGRLWRHQVPALVAAGFRVIVPDLRGYGGSDKPAEVSAYAMPFLVGDVVGVLGHDWGAALAWMLGSFMPDRVAQLVVLSVGHPTSFASAGYEQRERSWYMLLFQFEGVAEQWLSGESWRHFREWVRHPDTEAVIAELEGTGALTPALNWYRANAPPQVYLDAPPALPPVQADTMGVWSSGDFALTEAQMLGSAAHVAGQWRYERVDGRGHWLQLEAPDLINGLLLDFLRP